VRFGFWFSVYIPSGDLIASAISTATLGLAHLHIAVTLGLAYLHIATTLGLAYLHIGLSFSGLVPKS
jgi:hypothetical protein